MQKRPNKTFWWVFGVHASAVFLLLVIPLFKSCIHRKPKEIVQFVDLVSEAPAQVAPAPQPAPKTETPTPKVEKPTPAPTPTPKPKLEKPKWEPAKVIKQNKRVTKNPQQTTPVTPQRKQISTRDFQEALETTRATSSDPHLIYCTTLQPRFYSVWQQPTAAPYGTKATATIRVGSDGGILFRSLTVLSGNRDFDQSVQNALHAIQRLPAPPKESINRSITVDFVLD